MKLIANVDPEDRIWTPDEAGLAARIVAEWEGQLLWSAEMDSWLIWGKKSGVWAADVWEIAAEMGRGSAITHQRVWPLLDAGGARTGNPPLEKTGMIRNAMQLAKGRMACGLEDFDTDCWMLNCPDGSLDLTTGELLPHRGGIVVETITRALEDGSVLSEDVERRIIPDYNLMVTAVTPTVGSDGKAVWKKGDTPTWEKHLEVLCHGDEEIKSYLQLIMGMALIGDQSERKQMVLHWYGEGRNGKGIANEVYSALLGSYGMVASTRALTMKDDGHTTDLHDFKGKRWVYVEEVTKFNSSQLKDMSGGGVKRARNIGKDNESFRKSWILNLLSNKPIELQGDTSDGMWERLKRIDFGSKIPTEKQIEGWGSWLTSEWPGILAWAVQGCLRYQKDGYWEPVGVTMTVDVARGDDDALGQFLEERCVECEWIPGARGCSIRGSDFTSAYNEWRKTRYNNLVVPVPVVYADLRARKIEVERGRGNAIHIRGIIMRPLEFGDLAADAGFGL